MDNEYKKAIMKYNRIKGNLESKRQEILNSGKTSDWIGRELKAVREATEKELREWQANVKAVAQEYMTAGQDIAQEMRKAPTGKKLDPASLELHRAMAKDAFEGLTPDEMVKAFGRVVGGLSDDELGAKYVYENTLKSMLRDPSYEKAVESVISEHQTPIEQATLRELERRKVFLNNDSTIRGLAEMDIEAINDGRRPSWEDINDLHDAVMTNL